MREAEKIAVQQSGQQQLVLTLDEIPTLLHAHYPVWLLTWRGDILAANLMAFWLWEATKPEDLLGKNVFSILPPHFPRIPVAEDLSFYRAKVAAFKRTEPGLTEEMSTSFRNAMNDDEARKEIFESVERLPDKEWHQIGWWEYDLTIQAPEEEDRVASPLQFHVTIARLKEADFLLVAYNPEETIAPLIERKYDNRFAWYSREAYIQYLYPPYYPTITHNRLWKILDENRAHQLLQRRSFRGRNILDLFFAPEFRGRIVNWDEAAYRAFSWWFWFISVPWRAGHRDAAEYHEVIERLQTYSGFSTIYARVLGEDSPRPDPPPAELYFAFEACRVVFQSPGSKRVELRFRTLVRPPNPDPPHGSSAESYHEAFVPEDQETKATLIQMYLLKYAQLMTDVTNPTFEKQLILGRALAKTICDGIKSGNEYMVWDPETAFQAIYEELTTQARRQPESALDDLARGLRSDIVELVQQIGSPFSESFFNILQSGLEKRGFEYLHRFLLDTQRQLTYNEPMTSRVHAEYPARLISYPVYYPVLIDDRLLNIVNENTAHRLLMGTSVVRRNMLELFFTPEYRQNIENWADAAPVAVQSFRVLTSPYVGEESLYHREYAQIISHLKQYPGFLEMYQQEPQSQLPMPQAFSDWFFATAIDLRWYWSPITKLRFSCIVRRLGKDIPPHINGDHLVVLVPRDRMTKAALLLMHLEDVIPEDKISSRDVILQLVWGRALFRAILEGMQRGEDAPDWKPETIYKEIHEQLTAQFADEPVATADELVFGLRVDIMDILRQSGALFATSLFDILLGIMYNRQYWYLYRIIYMEHEISRRFGEIEQQGLESSERVGVPSQEENPFQDLPGVIPVTSENAEAHGYDTERVRSIVESLTDAREQQLTAFSQQPNLPVFVQKGIRNRLNTLREKRAARVAARKTEDARRTESA